MDFNPFAYEWEDEFTPQQTTPPQSSKERPTASSPIKVNTTPKRKRTDDSDGTKIQGTAPKRRSPLRQVHTLDYSTPSSDDSDVTEHTPTKLANSTSEASTPRTVVKGIAGFNIATPNKIDVLDLTAEELEDPFAPSASGPTSTLSPLFSPALTDFTSTPAKKVSSAETLATPATTNPGINKTTPANDKNHLNKTCSETTQNPSTLSATPKTKTPTTPHKPIPTSAEPLVRNQPTKRTPPTTQTPPPPKPFSTLHSTPRLAPQYIPTYASPNSPLKLRDPATFTLSPPYWKRWPAARYKRLATYLQETIDLSTFALAENISVEEAAHVFNAVVVGPLHDETEKMALGAEGRVQGVFRTLAEGKVQRVWEAGNGVRVKGELAGVRAGVVTLVGEKGDCVEVRFRELGERDREYVEGLVGGEEWRVLMREGSE